MKLFVYGTLRKGNPAYDKYIKDYLLSQYPAYAKGLLYQMKDRQFPALLNGDRMIIGEVFELVDDFDFTALDKYEEYYGLNNCNNLYHRKLIDIYDLNYQVISKAYIYFYNDQRENALKQLDYIIESNDYLNQ